MAAVYGAAETLLRREGQLTADQHHQLVTMITAQAARLSQITEEVLLTNQLDRGDLPLEREPVDVADVVKRTVEAMESQLPEPVVVDVQIPPDAGAASGDADRIQQVVVNLLDNAAKYGGAPVRVRVDRANGYVRICVADSGPGITRTDQERIFEKFYRADPQHARAPGGTGLGLYISRELVRRMGGRLDVRSEPGAGAEFIVELPRA
jgi:signal transduction histidine kinase